MLWRGGLAAAALGLALPASAQLTLTPTRNLQFGSLTVGGGGTVTVDTNGARTRSGAVFLLPSGSSTSASFTVTDNDPANLNKSFVITLPDSANLSNGSGGTMQLTNFTSNPPGSGLFSGSGQVLTVGATLTVDANQPRGTYSGTFNITINYQ